MITQVLDVFRARGLQAGGHTYKIDGYVSVDPTDRNQVKAAIAMFAANTIGIKLPQEWTRNSVWDVTNSPIMGRHDVSPIDYDEDRGVFVSSWGRVYLMTWAAFTYAQRRYVEEMYAMLAPLWYGNDKIAGSGFHVDKLQADLQKLGGGIIPDHDVVTPPSPGPTPSPAPTPTPIVPTGIVTAMIEAAFAQLEKQYQGQPIVLAVLSMAKAAVLQLFTTRAAMAAAPMDSPIVLAVVDEAIRLVEQQLASYATALSIFQVLKPVIRSIVRQFLEGSPPLLPPTPNDDLGPPPDNWR